MACVQSVLFSYITVWPDSFGSLLLPDTICCPHASQSPQGLEAVFSSTINVNIYSSMSHYNWSFILLVEGCPILVLEGLLSCMFYVFPCFNTTDSGTEACIGAEEHTCRIVALKDQSWTPLDKALRFLQPLQNIVLVKIYFYIFALFCVANFSF